MPAPVPAALALTVAPLALALHLLTPAFTPLPLPSTDLAAVWKSAPLHPPAPVLHPPALAFHPLAAPFPPLAVTLERAPVVAVPAGILPKLRAGLREGIGRVHLGTQGRRRAQDSGGRQHEHPSHADHRILPQLAPHGSIGGRQRRGDVEAGRTLSRDRPGNAGAAESGRAPRLRPGSSRARGRGSRGGGG
jgi:hypothetical protein